LNNKPLTDQQLFKQAERIGRVPEFEKYRSKILEMMDGALDEGQEDYAAFLFAFAAVANEVQRRKTRPKSH
jgi:hypothetical protein